MANEKNTENQSAFKELVLPVIVLVAICLLCSALLAVLNDITAPIIEENTKAETLAAYVSVLPEGTTSDNMTEVENLTTDGVLGAVTTANGDVAVKAAASGYSGKDVTVYVAFDAEGAVSNISIDASTQTTGIGSKVADDSFASGFVGWNGGEVSNGSPVDALASATPLASSVDRHAVSLLDMFLGLHGGMMGEVCVLAILLGFAYLVATKTIQTTIPVTIVATVFILTTLNTGDPYAALIECMSGGLLFGSVFMATDYVTSPFTTKGKLFYGVFIGLITFLIRHFGSMNEGMSYAILLGNLMTPWFNAWGHQTPLGYKKPKKAKKAAEEGGKV